jgi:hypothetical protein
MNSPRSAFGAPRREGDASGRAKALVHAPTLPFLGMDD